MKFSEVVEFFQTIEDVSSRNGMSLLTAQFLKKCNLKEAQILSYIMLGRVAPLFVNAEFNYSEKSLINLLWLYTKENVMDKRREIGDIGDTVMQVWSKYSENDSSYTLEGIYEILWSVVNAKGVGSVQEKSNIILNCLQKLSALESKYFVRIICGTLRLGLNARSLLDVYSIYLVGDKSIRDILEHAYGVCTDIGYIAGIVVGENALEKLSTIDVTPGTPVLSRLVERVGSFEEVFDRTQGPVILQPKFDGLRCQIHKWNKTNSKLELPTVWSGYILEGKKSASLFEDNNSSDVQVKLFTRNLEDVTEMFPEIVESATNIPLDSFVLDSEVLGWNYSKNTFLSYQETMQRRRKYKVSTKQESIPVKAFVFDILFSEGKSLIKKDTEWRVNLLQKKIVNTGNGISLAESKEATDIDSIKTYFKECVDNGLEGIIVKNTHGGYRPGVRNYEWIKIKRSIEKELVDTVDMVVVGYYYGSGRRSDLGVGAILCGILNKKGDTIDAICKVGTGIGDELLKEMKDKFEEIKIRNIPSNVRCPEYLIPDEWLEPKYVVTVDADEITRNISRSDAERSIGNGLSLRFPRLVEFGRDKLVEDISTVEELEEMYKMRKSI